MANIKQEYVYGPDHIASDGVTIYAKTGAQLTECMLIRPSYRNKGTYDALTKDMAQAVVILLENGISSHALAALLAKQPAETAKTGA